MAEEHYKLQEIREKEKQDATMKKIMNDKNSRDQQFQPNPYLKFRTL